MLPRRTAKGEPLHEISTATVNYLQLHNAILKFPIPMKVHIRRLSTLEVYQIKVICLDPLKISKKAIASLMGLGTVVELLPTSNLVLRAPLASDRPKEKKKG